MKSVNPATGNTIKDYEEHDVAEAETILHSTFRAFREWKKTEFADRSELLKNAAGILRDNTDKYATLMTEEMGKPIGEAVSEVEKCAWVCDYYAENAADFLADEDIETDMPRSLVTYQPLGVILAIMPWNFPFWQVFRFAAPALMAGNGGLLKHASNVPGCALAIEEIFQEAGFPENIFRTILLDKKYVDNLVEHEYIRGVTLTGSTAAGGAVASKAGQELKKTVLELGGSDPYLILKDADIEDAADICAKSRLINSGQSCIAAKRFLVVEDVYDEFLEAFKKKMESYTVGDPHDDESDLGPQARKDLRDDLHRQVTESVEQGADVILGGEIPDGQGAYYPPTILTGVEPGMPAFDEELFGPVAAVIRVQDDEEGIELANKSRYGLGAAVFTSDIEKGREIARDRIESGTCVVNDLVKSDPRVPFGGIKDSGYGRELSRFGIREFVNIKTIHISDT